MTLKLKITRALFLATCLIASFYVHAAKTADVIVNDEIAPLGMLEPLLKSHGYEINLIPAQQLDIAAVLQKNADILIILGGRQSVTRMEENPYLYDELALIRHREGKGRATLGICLGAQLMAVALGGRVEKGPAVEQGWITLYETAGAPENAPLHELIHSQTNVYASHEDAIVSIPQQAHLLAKSNMYNHAFISRKNTLALQFHPEATPNITNNLLSIFGGSPDIIAQKKYQNEISFAANRKGLEQFWQDWLGWIENSQSPSHDGKTH